jgi:hypothetical protein
MLYQSNTVRSLNNHIDIFSARIADHSINRIEELLPGAARKSEEAKGNGSNRQQIAPAACRREAQ